MLQVRRCTALCTGQNRERISDLDCLDTSHPHGPGEACTGSGRGGNLVRGCDRRAGRGVARAWSTANSNCMSNSEIRIRCSMAARIERHTFTKVML